MEQGNSIANAQVDMPVSASEQNNMMTQGVSEKKKGGKGMLYGMILCAILAIGGIGFGVWAMMDGNNQKSNYEEQISTLKKQNSELKEKIDNGASENDDVGTIPNSETSTDTWDNYSEQLVSQDMLVSTVYYSSLNNEEEVVNALKSNTGHLVITDMGSRTNGNDDKTIAELDDVLAVYRVNVGNGGVPYFYIIDRDGKVSRLNVSENSSRELEKVGDYSKVVSVFMAGSLEAVLVDIDGNIHKSY